MEIATTSTEYVHVNVAAQIAGAAVAIAAAPRFAILATSANPDIGDWLTGEWAGVWARVLIGPSGGAVTLEPGRYSVWISFAAGLETPVVRAGTLNVY